MTGDDRAAGNLRSALWRLRTAGPDMLEVDVTSLRLQPGITVDVDLVPDWAARLISSRPAATDLRLVDWPSDTVDLLPGRYDDWVVFERERLRQRLLHAFEALSRALLADGRWAEAIEVAMAAVGADPRLRRLVDGQAGAPPVAGSHAASPFHLQRTSVAR